MVPKPQERGDFRVEPLARRTIERLSGSAVNLSTITFTSRPARMSQNVQPSALC